MTTLFCDMTTGTLYKWNAKLITKCNIPPIKIADPISVEYGRIKIVSKKFNKIGSSKIMISNNVKTIHTKTQSLDNITYFDDDMQPEGKWNSRTRTFVISEFHPAKYGDPVCFYNPGYIGGSITIATQFWEIEEPGILCNITSFVSNILSMAPEITPCTPYLSVAHGIATSASKILSSMVVNEELTNSHILELRNDDNNKPFIPGHYVCFPDIQDINLAQSLIKEYYVMDGVLVKNVTNTDTDNVVEYDGSYFIFCVANVARPELNDFDFTASSNELLTELHKNQDPSYLQNFMRINKNSNDMVILQQLTDATALPSGFAKSMFNHLSENMQLWVKTNLPNVYNNI